MQTKAYVVFVIINIIVNNAYNNYYSLIVFK